MFKTGFKQIVLNSDPGIMGVTISDGAHVADPATTTGVFIPGFVTIGDEWSNMVNASATDGAAAMAGVYTITLTAGDYTVGDVADLKVGVSAEAVRMFPDIFSYTEIKLLSAKVADVTKVAEAIAAVAVKNQGDEYFKSNVFEVTGTGNVLTITFKKGYEGIEVKQAQTVVAVTKIVAGLPNGAVTVGAAVVATGTAASIGINTGKQIEAEVRNGFFENIDPYGVHFGGNDQGVDVRGLYKAYIFSTAKDQELGWEPHAGLGYGDANTETAYVARDYIVYALMGSSAETMMDKWAV